MRDSISPPTVRLPIAIIAGAALLGTIVGVSTAAPGAEPRPEPSVDAKVANGVGERVVLVLAGQYATVEEANDATQEFHFGDLQGFYIDASENYRILGYYGQSKPDIVKMRCEDVPPTAGECPAGQTVLAHRPVVLELHDLRDAPGLVKAAEAACDGVDQPPCVPQRLLGYLRRPDWQLKPGMQLLLSAFRTKRGAEEFAELARDRGATVVVVRARKLGGPYVGLGQESHPDGVSGPLLEPLADPDRYQR